MPRRAGRRRDAAGAAGGPAGPDAGLAVPQAARERPGRRAGGSAGPLAALEDEVARALAAGGRAAAGAGDRDDARALTFALATFACARARGRAGDLRAWLAAYGAPARAEPALARPALAAGALGDGALEALATRAEAAAALAPGDLVGGYEASLARGAAGARRRGGAFFTPEAVTRGLVAQGLGPALAPAGDPDGDPAAARALGDAGAAPRDAGPARGGRGAARDGAGAARGDVARVDPLALRVCDPACGAGAFLLAAQDALARAALARGLAPDLPRAAGLVARRCLAGVDRDADALALARALAWLATDLPLAALPDTLDLRRADALGGPWPRHAGEAEPRPGAGLASLAWPAAFPDVFSPARGPADPDTGAPGGFDVVLGNPPFLSALARATAPSPARRAWLRARWPGAFGAHADLSLAFLLLALDLARPGGRVTLVGPTSWLATRDGAGVRGRVEARAALEALWLARERVFAASVEVWAATWRKRGDAPGDGQPTGPRGAPRDAPGCPRSARAPRPTAPPTAPPSAACPADAAGGAPAGPAPVRAGLVPRRVGAGFAPAPPIAWAARDEGAPGRAGPTWALLVADLLDVPAVDLAGADGVTFAQVAQVTADFRDEDHGLRGLVLEDAPDLAARRAEFPPLVTTGLIDLAGCAWGARSTRFDRRAWAAPVVDLAALARRSARLGAWARARLAPKALLATQTAVLEVVVDAAGAWLPCTPVVSVVPREPGRVWHLAAALAAPPLVAAVAHAALGTALVDRAVKPSAAQVRALPLPRPGPAWDEAADRLRAAQAAAPGPGRAAHLVAGAAAGCAAYGLAGPTASRLLAWWRGRARLDGSSAAVRPT